jgi:hypothetical protein
MTNLIKQAVLTTLSFACLCFSFSAQADFRKALDAYIARDGDAMLKEVKHAVDTKNCDGMHSFVMKLRFGSMRHEPLSSLINTKQQSVLFSLLNRILEESNKGDDYFEIKVAIIQMSYMQKNKLDIKQRAFSREIKALAIQAESKITNKLLIEYIAQLLVYSCADNQKEKLECLTIAAKLGDPYAQSDLGYLYFGEKDISNYSRPVFMRSLLSSLSKNDKEADYWISSSVRNAQFPRIPASYCALAKKYHTGAESNKNILKQAYLLYLWAHLAHAENNDFCANQGLIALLNDGTLRRVAPDYSNRWEEKNKRLNKKRIRPLYVGINQLDLPSLATPRDKLLVFSYEEGFAGVYVYADGQVDFRKGLTVDRRTISKEKVKSFIAELNSIKVMDLPIYSGSLFDHNESYYSIYAAFNGEFKVTYSRNLFTSYQVLKTVDEKIPNPYLRCDKKKCSFMN